MENKWFPNGGGPSLESPDPPDDSLFLAEFPRLSPTAGVDSHSLGPSSSTALPVKESLDTVMNDSTSTTMVDSSISASTTSHVTDGSVPDLGKSTSIVQFKGFTVLQSKKSITFPSPKAAKYVRKTLPPSGSHSSAQRSQPRQKSRLISTSVFSDQINTSVLEDHQPAHKTRESSANATGQAIFTTDSGTESVPVVNKSVPLVETLRRKVDRSLKRQGPAAVSALGTPSVHIPEEVYIRGAQVHKEFISCFFCGRAPPCLFWLHNWSPMGDLRSFLTGASARMGIPSSATLSDLYVNDQWSLRPARSDAQVSLQAYLACGINNGPLAEDCLEFYWHSEAELFVLASHVESMPNKRSVTLLGPLN